MKSERLKTKNVFIPFAEEAKIFIDFGKHLTAVASGSVVIAATLIDKQSLHVSPAGKWMFIAAVTLCACPSSAGLQ
jgi:hypothetical protein